MGTEAQLKANQANAQHSTGPKSPEGKAAVSQNNFRHGLSGVFQVLPWEKQEEFDDLRARLRAEHQAYSPFEAELIEKWRSSRGSAGALALQEACFSPEPLCEQQKQLALYLRYQTTHERAFERCVGELRRLRKEREEAKIGFESQERK